MLEKRKIGRTKRVKCVVRDELTDDPIAALSGTAQCYDEDTGDAIGDPITMETAPTGIDQEDGVIWAIVPNTLGFSQDQNIEVRATISGTGVTNEQQSAYFVAGRWE